MYCGRIEPSILSGHLPYPWEQENREGRLRDEMRKGRSRYGEKGEGETLSGMDRSLRPRGRGRGVGR